MIFGLSEKITNRVDEVILGFKARPDVVIWLKDHEKRPLLEKNLLKTINESNLLIKNQETIDRIIDDFAKNFCIMAIEAKKIELMSEAEKQRRLHEEHEFNEIQEMLEENSNTRVEDWDGKSKK